ncbi:MAG: hypothetical protein ACFFE8_07125 [Candidatus Heimdallarchaeota archaeon]
MSIYFLNILLAIAFLTGVFSGINDLPFILGDAFVGWIVPYIGMFRPHFFTNYYHFQTDIYPQECSEAKEGKKETNWGQTIILCILMIPAALFGTLILLIGILYLLIVAISFPAYLISVNLPFNAKEKREVFKCAKCNKALRDLVSSDDASCPKGGSSKQLTEAIEQKDYSILKKIYPILHRKHEYFIKGLIIALVSIIAFFVILGSS